MYKVVIVEDEKSVLELMKYVIGQQADYQILGAFTNPLEALAALPDLDPDVVFLDVEMPKMNGLELAQKVNELFDQTKIVFTTAHRDYALEAFSVSAFDYILKPVTPTAIERVTQRLQKQARPSAPVKARVQSATIQCFGGFEVRNAEGALVRWPTRKTEELFAFFLCHPGRDINKWRLSDFLWGDMEEERATHNLHNTIYRLKKMLKAHEIGVDILKTNEGYMLDVLQQSYDVLEFQRYESRSVEGSWEAGQAEHLCSLYKGQLLERKDYLWKGPLEESYRKQYTSLVRQLVLHEEGEQNWKKAERQLESYLMLYPLDEEMNLSLLRLYARGGNKEILAKHAAQFESAYRQELGLELPAEIKDQLTIYLG